MEALILNAKSRDANATRAKDVREQNDIPAVVYGHGTEARAISVSVSEFRKVYAKAGSSSLVDIVVDGGAAVKAVIKEVQPHHLTMQPLHIDFHQVRMDEKMTARVPLVFTGESLAIKALGGTLMKSFDALEVSCLPADLPHEITVDLSVLKTFDDAITVATLSLPKGVEVLTEATATIATVSAPLTEEELKKMEEGSGPADVTAVKTEAEIKKAEEEAKKAEEEKAAAE
jgi:large subunit ribosomal protein L25